MEHQRKCDNIKIGNAVPYIGIIYIYTYTYYMYAKINIIVFPLTHVIFYFSLVQYIYTYVT